MGKGASAATALYAVFRPRGEGIVRIDTDGEHIVSVVGDQCTAGIIAVAGNVSHPIAAMRPVGAACRFDVFLHGIDRFDVLLCQAVFVVVAKTGASRNNLHRLRICRADDLYYPGRTGCLGKNTGARRRRSDGEIPQGGGMPTPRMIFPSAADEDAAAAVRVPSFPAGNRRRR